MQGRNGPRTMSQRVRELLKRSNTRYSERYAITGKLKEGSRAPRKVSLAKIELPEPKEA
jgi:hypothetical protein